MIDIPLLLYNMYTHTTNICMQLVSLVIIIITLVYARIETGWSRLAPTQNQTESKYIPTLGSESYSITRLYWI